MNPALSPILLRMIGKILDLVKDRLCTRCGTCVGICPKGALSLDEACYPTSNGKGCQECHLCWEVCPGKSENYADLEARGQEGDPSPWNVNGHVRTVYLGRAMDPAVLRSGSSGGLVTQLLIHALERGEIQGALLAGYSAQRPWEAEPVLARTPEEVLSCAGSKYCVVSTNAALRDAKKIEGRIGYVGLPCHVRGLRLLMQKDSVWRDKIAMVLGLYCHHAWESEAALWLMMRRGIDPKKVRQFRYREGNWPGRVQTRTNGTWINLHSERIDDFISYILLTHAPNRCLLCTDAPNRLADLSFADAWLPKEIPEQDNWTAVVVRTRKGEVLLEQAHRRGVIRLETTDMATALCRQERMAREKHAMARVLIKKRTRRAQPFPDMPREPSADPWIPLFRRICFETIYFLRQFRVCRALMFDLLVFRLVRFRGSLRRVLRGLSPQVQKGWRATHPK